MAWNVVFINFLFGNDLKFVKGDVHAWRAVPSIASIACDHAVVFIRTNGA